jgi:broad specificity phosphatase PhoE
VVVVRHLRAATDGGHPGERQDEAHVTLLMLVRHGETEDNRLQIFQGHGGSPLNAAGIAQAEALALRLRDVRIDHVVASDLERAHQTASIVMLSHAPLAVRLDARLREVDVGAWQGLHREEIQERFADEWEAWRRGEDARRGGGETYREAGARAKALVLECCEHAKEEDTLLMVSHAGTIRALTSQLLDAPLEAFAPVRNTGLTCIEWSKGRGKLHLWSDVMHDCDPVSFLPRKAAGETQNL